jgi:hypothetical protein
MKTENKRKAGTALVQRSLALIGAMGTLVSTVPAHAGIERERSALESRVSIARKAIQEAKAHGVAQSPALPGSEQVAQQRWWNWGNWGNWANWPNWPNWANWFNR